MEMFAGREYKADRKTFEQDGVSNDEIKLCIHSIPSNDNRFNPQQSPFAVPSLRRSRSLVTFWNLLTLRQCCWMAGQ